MNQGNAGDRGASSILRLLQEGRAREALDSLSRQPQTDLSAEDLYLKGLAATLCGELALAQSAIDACLARSDAHPGAHFQRAVIALQRGERALALQGFADAVQRAPSWAEAHYNLAVLQGEDGDTAAAELGFRNALRFNPGLVQAANNLANLLVARGDAAAARSLLGDALSRQPDFAVGWCSLGWIELREGRLQEAATALQRSLNLNPEQPTAWENLGEVLQRADNRAAATEAYARALALDPACERVRFKLATQTGEAPPRPPDQIVRSLFDDLAAEFDQRLVEELAYRLPSELQQHLSDLLVETESVDILDLGCGTGLAGAALRPWAKRLAGVDLSGEMLKAASARSIYDQLAQASLQQFMQTEPAASWDLILAADVFVYVGALEEVFGEAHRLLRPGGHLVFSVELCGTGDYALEPTGRYQHSEAYLRRLATTHGFDTARMTSIDLRSEQGVVLPGLLVVLAVT